MARINYLREHNVREVQEFEGIDVPDSVLKLSPREIDKWICDNYDPDYEDVHSLSESEEDANYEIKEED